MKIRTLGLVLAVFATLVAACGSTATETATEDETATDQAVVEEDADSADASETPAAGEVVVSGDNLPQLDGPDDAAVGSTAPTFTAETFDGTTVEVGGDGTARIYGFFAHWCPHCQAEVPIIVDYLENNTLPEGVEIVGISTAVDPERDNFPPADWFAAEEWPALVVQDGNVSELAQAFGLTSFPFWVAVDADGTVVSRTAGSVTPEALTNVINQLDPAA